MLSVLILTCLCQLVKKKAGCSSGHFGVLRRALKDTLLFQALRRTHCYSKRLGLTVNYGSAWKCFEGDQPIPCDFQFSKHFQADSGFS